MMQRIGWLAVLLCVIGLPQGLHAEGKDSDLEDHFAPDQVRSFTRTATLPGKQRATATVLALHRHESAVQHVFDVAMSELYSAATRLNAGDPGSDIARINARAHEKAVAVGSTTIEMLQIAKKVHKLTNGIFDVVAEGTFGSITDLKINTRQNTVAITNPKLRIDVGELTDGYLADRLMAAIWNANIDNAMVEVGSVSRSVGNDVVGQWRKVVTDMAGRYAARGMALSFSNAAAATIALGSKTPGAGSRLGEHVIGADLQSATVIAKDGATAKGVANAIYKLGADKGMELANRLPNVKAVLRDNAGTLHKSRGL